MGKLDKVILSGGSMDQVEVVGAGGRAGAARIGGWDVECNECPAKGD